MLTVINHRSHTTSSKGVETRLVTGKFLLDINVGVGEASELEKFIRVFTHPRFDVVTGNIVPLDSVIVEVVEDGDARLVSAVLTELTVVGLSLSATTIVGPVPAPSLSAVGGWDSARRTRPEPSVDENRLKIGTITSVKVAFATRGPDVFDIGLLDLAIDEIGLILGFKTYQILAMLSADISGIEPISLMRGCGFVIPGEEVIMTVSESGCMTHSVLTGRWVRPDKLTLGSCHCHQCKEY